VWHRAVELARVARGKSGERGSHAQVESPARDSGGRLRFFKTFLILSKKTPTISVTYKNSHKKSIWCAIEAKRTLKRKKESCTDGE
jgi:hypothetical protein